MRKSGDSNVDSFATFLESINRQQSAQKAPSGPPLKLLTILATSGPQLVPDLLTASGMAFTDFTGALNTMKEAGLITLAGPPEQEKVALTASGEQVAHLAS
jgi:hypothetical protein